MKLYRSLNDFAKLENAVVSQGTFDGVHVGHQEIIKQMKQVAAKTGGPTVMLTFFPHPRMVLYPDNEDFKLLQIYEEKVEQFDKYGLDHLIVEPFTIPFSRYTTEEFVKEVLVNRIGAKHIVVGHDHRFAKNREGTFKDLQNLSPTYGFSVSETNPVIIDGVTVSSTKIRNALLSGDVGLAKRLLGYDYQLKGVVKHGNKVGRTIEFPTANIYVLEKYKLVPGEGVYAVKVDVLGEKFNGMLNIGKRPTVGGSGDVTIEVHLIDSKKDLYGRVININFVEKIRNEIKFPTMDDLKKQLEKDKFEALRLLA
ncbi:MAG: bifunctional riboflavin kinase/FAD synthetase [Bacteroidia bacterium]|nr:bifunctional riboflavin kinase/FAD synthetase [Bacteroidia bacterium]